MHIGIDARMYSSKFTGIGRYNFELIQHLKKIDHKNQYSIFLNDPEFEIFEDNAQFQKVRVNAKHYSLAEQITFLKKIYEVKPDLMHFTHFNNPIFYLRPQVVTIHDLTLSFYPGKKMTSVLHRIGYNLSVRSVLAKAKKIIAVSKNTKKDVMDLFHVPEEKIQVIYEGASDKFSHHASEVDLETTKKKFSITKPFLLYTGVWRDHKNVVGLIRAFHSVREIYNLDIELVITGKPDPVYHEVLDTIDTLKLKKHVKCVGLVSEKDLTSLYQSAALYVFPSFYEGFGIPPLEAFAAGLPVVCSNTSSLPEICGEGNAVFFDPNNVQDMAEKIADTLQDTALQKNLIQRGFERLRIFSWEEMARETLNIYKSALNKHL